MLSKSSKYAIRAVLYIGINASPLNKISPREIAAGIQVPTAYLAKLLQVLTKRNLISGTRGRQGGFFLKDAQRLQTLIAIVDAIDGLAVLGECTLGLTTCSNQHPCPFHATTAVFREALVYELSSHTIDELCRDIVTGNVRIDDY
ncbi:Rrf2 family transcriptional regulator [Flavobacteriaceae bacterium F08102]|nr:Rrf2 family transcriptional regulator [Flavobacteriaceae bacterium F08102]